MDVRGLLKRRPILGTLLQPGSPSPEQALKLDEELVAHEFAVSRYTVSTTYSVMVPFSKSSGPFSLSGEFDEDVTVELDVIEGHGWLRPSVMKVYEHRYEVRAVGMLKSVASFHCRTTITVRGRDYVVADGWRNLNIPVSPGDEIVLRFENPSVVVRIGAVDVVVEYVSVGYLDIRETVEVR